MGEIYIVVDSVPPDGWRWKLENGTETIRTGTARTEQEARTAAEKAFKEIRGRNTDHRDKESGATT